MKINIPILNCCKCGSRPDQMINSKLNYIWLECPRCRPFRRTLPYKMSEAVENRWTEVVRDWNLMNKNEKKTK